MVLSRVSRLALQSSRRSLSTSITSSTWRTQRPLFAAFSAAVGLSIGISFAYCTSPSPLLAESSGNNNGYFKSQLHAGKAEDVKPAVFIWGRHWQDADSPTLIRRPRRMTSLDGFVLRDLALAEKSGVAVDANGDVLQWGLGFLEGSEEVADITRPVLTLKGRDIVRVALANSKVYALSRKGEVFVFPCDWESQRVGAEGRAVERSWVLTWFSRPETTDVELLLTDVPLKRGERFVSISAGKSHLLALTSAGRAFASPVSLSANHSGQLAVRRVALRLSSAPDDAPLTELIPDLSVNEKRWEIPPPPAKLDPLLLPHKPAQVAPTISVVEPVLPEQPLSPAEVDPSISRAIRFCTTLHEIPALRGIHISELVAGADHSLARTPEGRVLGWGANNYGQLGLGTSLSYPTIPTPTEIPLNKSYPKATRLVCTALAAGGNNSYFVVEREDIQTGTRNIDVLATGNGQFGGIGNGSWAHVAQAVKVKTISGLREWNEASKSVEPIAIRELSVGRTHVMAVLDNSVEQPGGIQFGRDVFVWGHNEWFQLGTGKRSNLPTPQHLGPLPYPGLIPTVIDTELPSSGTISPMPHSRLQLSPARKIGGRLVEEVIVSGDGGSAVYWRVLQP